MNNTKISLYDIIRELTHGINQKDEKTGYTGFIKSEHKGQPRTLWGCNYLLNQVIRQIEVPEEHRYVSKAAQELWDKIQPICKKNKSKNINDFNYREKLKATKSGAEIFEFKGSNSKPIDENPRTLNVGDSFVFRDVFHVEHIVPVTKIIDQLIEYDKAGELTDENIDKVLNNIYVCRILKAEDRKIKEKYRRPDDVERVLKEIYFPRKIDVER